jgi:hypothetical protein
MTRMDKHRHGRTRTDTRLLYHKSKPVSDEAFNAFMGFLYEQTGAQKVTGMVILAAGGYVGVFDAYHCYGEPFWINCEPGNPRNIEDQAIVTVYGIRDRNGDFVRIADVFIHKPGSKVYEEVHAL